MNRFARPDEITLTLTHGDTITVRREITHGERIAAMERAIEVQPDGRIIRRPLLSGMALVTSFLIDWTFCDASGARLPIRGLSPEALTAVLNQLLPESFAEIKDAIDAHEAQLAREHAHPEALPPSAPISESLNGVAGGTSGSAT